MVLYTSLYFSRMLNESLMMPVKQFMVIRGLNPNRNYEGHHITDLKLRTSFSMPHETGHRASDVESVRLYTNIYLGYDYIMQL